MTVTRVSQLTGKVSSMELNVTQQQLDDYRDRKGLLQNIFPNLTTFEREFIKTGITPQEWEEFIPQHFD